MIISGICEICGAKTGYHSSGGVKSIAKTCSRKCSNIRMWQNSEIKARLKKSLSNATTKKFAESKEYREKHSAGRKKYCSTDEFKEKSSELLKKTWQENSSFRQHHSDRAKNDKLFRMSSVETSSIRLKKLWQNKEYRKKMCTQSADLWTNGEFRNKFFCRSIKQEPNRPEQKLYDILLSIDRKFQFTGNGCKPIKYRYPDFIHEEKKLIVEMFGDYWHRNDTIEKINNRIKLFKSAGYDTLIIWEHELKNELVVKNKILEKIDEARTTSTKS